jgi:hypothetical protein
MDPRRRTLLALCVIGLLALVGASGAFACGTGGYTYAGLGAQRHAFGIAAVITPLAGFDVRSGHVAGWVGVGGPGQGLGGQDEWLQVGFSGFPGIGGSDIYYETMRPNGVPTYHQVAAELPLGRSARVSVLEMHHRLNYWRVWVNGSAVSKPILLPGSHGRWAPMATAESWDGGGGGGCNGFLYRFRQVSIASAPGGSWVPLVGGYAIRGSTTRVARNTGKGSFFAAQGAAALRTLASVSF